jgi:hypothetical protein
VRLELEGVLDRLQRTSLPPIAAWIALAAAAGYAVLLHQGVGSPPGGYATKWWHPTQFLTLSATIGGWTDIPYRGAAILTAPAALLAVIVFLGTRSAVARALAVSLVITVASFAYSGFVLLGPWELFHWRWSLVLVWTGLILGFTLLSPQLSAAWLQQRVLVRLLLYAPVAFAVIAVIRNATGTDETLFSNFSPWPVIPVVGFEVGAYTIAGVLLGVALALGGLSQAGKRPAVVIAGLLAGVVFPSIWFYGRFETTPTAGLVALAVGSAASIGLWSITRGGDRAAVLGRRAAHVALGATLVVLPIFAGRAWADADYGLNKFVRARVAQRALAAYRDRVGVYPDEISELVDGGYLEELPRPRVGFDFLYDAGLLAPISFSYRGLGSSYVLEFLSTEWVQCAYSPAWELEEGEELEDEEDDESGEAWSCPGTRPALWGDGSGEEEEEDW